MKYGAWETGSLCMETALRIVSSTLWAQKFRDLARQIPTNLLPGSHDYIVEKYRDNPNLDTFYILSCPTSSDYIQSNRSRTK